MLLKLYKERVIFHYEMLRIIEHFICTHVLMQSVGVLTIQLAHYHGVKVLTTAISPDDQKFLEQLRPSVGKEVKHHHSVTL